LSNLADLIADAVAPFVAEGTPDGAVRGVIARTLERQLVDLNPPAPKPPPGQTVDTWQEGIEAAVDALKRVAVAVEAGTAWEPEEGY
jgi:hypothetical protein